MYEMGVVYRNIRRADAGLAAKLGGSAPRPCTKRWDGQA